MIDLNEELDDTEGDEIFEFEENKEDFSKAYLEDVRETMIIDIVKEFDNSCHLWLFKPEFQGKE